LPVFVPDYLCFAFSRGPPRGGPLPIHMNPSSLFLSLLLLIFSGDGRIIFSSGRIFFFFFFSADDKVFLEGAFPWFVRRSSSPSLYPIPTPFEASPDFLANTLFFIRLPPFQPPRFGPYAQLGRLSFHFPSASLLSPFRKAERLSAQGVSCLIGFALRLASHNLPRLSFPSDWRAFLSRDSSPSCENRPSNRDRHFNQTSRAIRLPNEIREPIICGGFSFCGGRLSAWQRSLSQRQPFPLRSIPGRQRFTEQAFLYFSPSLLSATFPCIRTLYPRFSLVCFPQTRPLLFSGFVVLRSPFPNYAVFAGRLPEPQKASLPLEPLCFPFVALCGLSLLASSDRASPSRSLSGFPSVHRTRRHGFLYE